MLRGFLILALIGYAFYRIFRFFTGGSLSENRRSYQQQTSRENPNVQTNSSKSPKGEKSYRGGEYIDYEEVD